MRAALALAVVVVLAMAIEAPTAHAQSPPTTMTLNLSGARAVWVQDAVGEFHPYIIGAPAFVNASFVSRWVSDGTQPATGVALNLGGARSVWVQDTTREFHSYIIGAPAFVNASFAEHWIIDGPFFVQPPTTPVDLRLAKVDIPFDFDDIWVTWDAVPGATWYEVYHSTGGEFDFEHSVTDTGYLDQYPNIVPGLLDSYKVRACNAAGCSDLSSSATETAGSLISVLSIVGETLADLVGFDLNEACGQLLRGAVDLFITSFLPPLAPLAGLIGELIGPTVAEELGCQ